MQTEILIAFVVGEAILTMKINIQAVKLDDYYLLQPLCRITRPDIYQSAMLSSSGRSRTWNSLPLPFPAAYIWVPFHFRSLPTATPSLELPSLPTINFPGNVPGLAPSGNRGNVAIRSPSPPPSPSPYTYCTNNAIPRELFKTRGVCRISLKFYYLRGVTRTWD